MANILDLMLVDLDSSLLWTDTRTGMQELFMSRIAVQPTDVYIRDSSDDIGAVPSPSIPHSIHRLVLSVRSQPDGNVNFVDESVNWGNENYVYGLVVNSGENTARNVKLAVTRVKYGSPSFTYPEDWVPDDWSQSQDTHLFLGERFRKYSGEEGSDTWPGYMVC